MCDFTCDEPNRNIMVIPRDFLGVAVNGELFLIFLIIFKISVWENAKLSEDVCL